MSDHSVQNLLNPCHCKTTGICKCCKPKTERRSGGQSSGSCCSSSDDRLGTDTLVEMYKSRAHNAEASSSRLQPPEVSPNSHAHRTAHRAKLYSPYTTPRHTSKSPVATPSSTSSSYLPSRLRPLADMNSFLGAVFNADGTTASVVSRAALGLPGITTFDTKAAEGGVKVESMEIDNDEPVAFPTSEDVIIGACTCGADCDCPGCSIHGNAPGGDHGPDHTACGHGCKSSFDCTNHLAIPSGATSVEHLLSLAAANVPPPPRTHAHEIDAHDTRVMGPSSGLSPSAALQHGIVQLKPLECCNGRCQCQPGTCSCEKDCCGCCIRCACAEDPEGDSNMNANRRESAGGCCSTGPTTTTIPTGHARNPSLSVTAPIETDYCGSSSGTGSGHSPNPSLSFSSADEYFRPSPTLSHHSPRPSLSISTAADGTPLPPFNLDSAGSYGNATLGVNQPTPPLLSPESARVPSQGQGIPLLSPESARHPGGSSPSSPHSPHSPRSPRSSRSSLKGRKSAQSSRSSTPAREDGEPATKRRASFTQQGGMTVADGNESRRATIATHSPTPSLSRSASTGKASSKALALNTQPNHPSHRNSTSKANSSSSGHLLPPKAGASATSPHRRRASSGTGHHSPRTATPEPRSPISHGHSASLGHAPGDFHPPSSISISSLPQFSNEQQPPQINIDSVNDEDEFVPDADLLAYINQLTSSSAGESIPPNYNFDFINPFDTTQQPMQMGRDQDMNMNNMGPNSTISTGDFLSMLNQINQPLPQQQMPSSTSTVLSQSMSGLYLGQPQPPMLMGGYDQSQPRSRDPMHNEYAYMLQQQQQQQQQQQPHPLQDPSKMYHPNPNLIDLSKPLDAGDVERILRALQDQQSQNDQPQPQQPMQHPQRPPMQMHQQQQQQQQQHQMPQMMLPQHMPQYTMQQPPPPPQDDLFDKFMLDPSPSAPETNGQSSGFDFNQMYGGINPNHVHSSMSMQMNGNGQNVNANGQNGGDQLTWDQLRLWAASHGMQAPPGPM